MTSVTCATPNMILQYEWILEDVEEDPKTFASKMILFRGEKVFRVGLKNHVESPVLFFMAIDLNKIGMKVKEVMFGNQGSGIGPATITKMEKENIGDDEGNLQLFTIKLPEMISGKTTFVFRICIEGSVPGYSYQLSDRLAKDQLWEAAKSKNSVDVEFVVKGKTFYAHKAILAARSLVFEAQFTTERLRNNGCVLIQIDGDVEPSTVEQFLYFIYTGESMGTFAKEELLKLAVKYEISTLSSLCRVALEKIKPLQMASIVINLNKDSEIPSSSIIRPEKDTEIFFDGTTPTFRFTLSLDISKNQTAKCVANYEMEPIFSVYVTGKVYFNNILQKYFVRQPVVHCLCHKHRSFGFEVEDIYFGDKQSGNRLKMKLKNLRKNAELLHFTMQPQYCVRQDSEFSFDIKIVSTIGNYYYEMMDDDWMNDFWFAAINQKLTDVEIFVGTAKMMEAHQIILSARSPVLNGLLSKISNTGKSIVAFGAEFDVDIVEHFLQFLYTGYVLETSASHKQLLKLATMYEVETLKSFCRLANRVLDVEEIANSLLEL